MILEELTREARAAKEIQAILDDEAQAAGRSSAASSPRSASDFADKRRTKIAAAAARSVEFDRRGFIVDEEATVVVTRDGWMKRVREVKDPSATRLREGDAVLAVAARLDEASRGRLLRTSATPTSCASTTCRRSTGYGEPVQKLFKLPRRRARRRRAAA